MSAFDIAFYAGIAGIITGIIGIFLALWALYSSIKTDKVAIKVNGATLQTKPREEIIKQIIILVKEMEEKDSPNDEKLLAQLDELRVQIVEKSIKSED